VNQVVIRPSLKIVKFWYYMVLAVVAGIGFLQVHDMDRAQPLVPSWTPALVGAVLMIFPAKRHLQVYCTRLTLSEDRLRYDQGIFTKTTRNLQLSKVQDVRVDQTLRQRILSVGDLTIETAGEAGLLTVHDIDRPHEVAEQILEAAPKGGATPKGGARKA
jgi:uncharacterized membrane protein YdbT with pleckstrin-like domain